MIESLSICSILLLLVSGEKLGSEGSFDSSRDRLPRKDSLLSPFATKPVWLESLDFTLGWLLLISWICSGLTPKFGFSSFSIKLDC